MLDRVIFAAGALEHGRHVQMPFQLSGGARKILVSILILAEPALRQRQIIENPLVVWRQLCRALQTIYSGAIVAVLIKRESEIVQGLRVLWGAADGFIKFIFGPLRQPLSIIGNAQKIVCFTKRGIQ